MSTGTGKNEERRVMRISLYVLMVGSLVGWLASFTSPNPKDFEVRVALFFAFLISLSALAITSRD